jgi:hypothetical protein
VSGIVACSADTSIGVYEGLWERASEWQHALFCGDAIAPAEFVSGCP